MSTADEKPMSGTTFVVMTVLMVLGALFLLRWVLSTVAFLFNTLLLVVLIGGAVFLYVKARGRR
jgi:ABC-type enterochelin transport system permease subunit